MAWHNGLWWPLYTTAWYSPKVSQYMFDPYSFTHVLHGVILQPIIRNITSSFPGGLLSCLLLELGWEVLENSPAVMRRFRANSGTSGQYHGDSVQNIMGDLVSCGAGYVVSTVLGRCGLGWARVAWVAVSEVGTTVLGI